MAMFEAETCIESSSVVFCSSVSFGTITSTAMLLELARLTTTGDGPVAVAEGGRKETF